MMNIVSYKSCTKYGNMKEMWQFFFGKKIANFEKMAKNSKDQQSYEYGMILENKNDKNKSL